MKAATLFGFLMLSTALSLMGQGVIAGRVTLTTNGSVLTADKNMINWPNLTIHNGGPINFVQPNAFSSSLNRVGDGNPPYTNPSGWVVGSNGDINSMRFEHSQLGVIHSVYPSNEKLRFSCQSATKITKLDSFEVGGGDVFLITEPVVGVGTAKGYQVLLQQANSGSIFIQASRANTLLSQSGAISATAADLKQAGGNTYALAINQSGLTQATEFSRSGGHLYLRASSATQNASSSTSSAAMMIPTDTFQPPSLAIKATEETQLKPDQTH